MAHTKINFAKREKKHVVFMPYKAALWDCLASVYEAARQDRNATVSVVPIPWYEVDEQDQVTVMHDESDMFSGDLKIVPWKKYDIRRKKPDIVFVHNPYDGFNSVSRVHENFYLKNIRPYVRELVYVPYYVAIDGKVPKDRLMSAGLDYADLLPVESEQVKEQYIEVFRNFWQEEGRWPEKERELVKFQVLGSPKFDCVCRPRPQDEELPQEWVRCLYDGAGRRKPVIFYNISVQALYIEKGRMLDKIERVLQSCREQREQVALLWRPHPMYRESVAYSCPERLMYYDELVSQYRAEAWGIYDDTADMYRSIALSDAYYGDMSSVVSLYQRTGKPIMIQNCSV